MANLDGDFVALKEAQKKKLEEKERLQEITQGILKKLGTIAPVDDTNEKERKVSTEKQDSQDVIEIRTATFEAVAKNDAQACRAQYDNLTKLKKNFRDGGLRDPDNKATILHCAIDNNATDVLDFIFKLKDDALLMETFDIAVRGIPSKKTALHVLAEKGDLELTKKLLDALRNKDSKKSFLHQTVLTDMVGQRPRHLTGLHLASLHGHTEMVQYFVRVGVDVNLPNNKKDTPALWASRGNHIETMRALIKLKANLTLENDKGSTPLYFAVRYGLTEMVRVLIKEGKANVHQSRKLGLVSPIVLASALGYAEILKILIENGARVDLKIDNGFTPLHHAATQGNMECVEILLNNTATVDLTNDDGDSALLLASKEHQHDVITLLVAFGANFTQSNKKNVTVWHHAIDCPNTDLLLTLVECYKMKYRMVDKKLTFPLGKTPLHICAAKNDCEKLQCLLDMVSDPNTVDDHGNTVFHIAAKEGNGEILEQFMSFIDVNAVNEDKDTALHLAARYGHLNCVEILVKKIKVDVTNDSGDTALHVACKSKMASVEVVELIVDSIVKAHNWSLVDAANNRGDTALHAAAEAEREEIMFALHHLNPKVANNDGNSPLQVAAITGRIGLVETMLNVFRQPGKGLEVDQKNGEGETLLFIAAKQGMGARVEYLIHQGADLAIKNHVDNTILHCLILESVKSENKESIGMYLEVLNRIVDSAAAWWCRKNDLQLPDEGSENFEILTRIALLELLAHITNSDKVTVVALAAKTGAKKMLKHILRIEDVFSFKEGDAYSFDVTNLVPETVTTSKGGKNNNNMLPEKYTAKVGSMSDVDKQEQSRESALELIVKVEPIELANELLDIPPFKQMVADHWSAYQWLYGVLLCIHVVYMSCLSAYSVPIQKTLLGNHLEGNNSLKDEYTGAKIFPNILFLTWPLILILFELYYIIVRIYNRCRNRDIADLPPDFVKVSFRHPTSFIIAFFEISLYYLTHIICIAFCILCFTWMVLFRFENRFQPHVLAATLVVGWLYTIAFTKGFESVHAFSIMLKYIIIRDISRFFVIYLIVLFAFSFATMVLLQLAPSIAEQYPSAGHVMFLMFNMMIGMASLFEDDFEGNYEKYGYSSIPIIIVYLIYIVLATVILLNLLIALMSDSYQMVRSREGTTWRVNSVKMAIQIEKIIPWLPKMFRALGIKEKNIYLDSETNRWKIQLPQSRLESEGGLYMDDTMRAVNRLENKVQHLQTSYTALANLIGVWVEKSQESSELLERISDSVGVANRPKATAGKDMSSIVAAFKTNIKSGASHRPKTGLRRKITGIENKV